MTKGSNIRRIYLPTTKILRSRTKLTRPDYMADKRATQDNQGKSCAEGMKESNQMTVFLIGDCDQTVRSKPGLIDLKFRIQIRVAMICGTTERCQGKKQPIRYSGRIGFDSQHRWPSNGMTIRCLRPRDQAVTINVGSIVMAACFFDFARA